MRVSRLIALLRVSLIWVSLVCATGVIAGAGSLPALGATTPAQTFAKGLSAKIKPVFEKQAPNLVLGLVTCVLPKNGTVVNCKAHFADKPDGANIVYAIKATLQESGTIKWTTTGHTCANAKTGKKLAC
jgi:hypothetical protein